MATQQKNAKQSRSSKSTQTDKNLLEWIVFGVSLLLVLGIVGYFCYEAITHKPTSPNVTVRWEKDRSKDNPYRYHVYVVNTGGQTAEDVQVEAQLIRQGKPIESVELAISFSPKWSEREGWINFTKNPAEADSVSIKVVSYKKP